MGAASPRRAVMLALNSSVVFAVALPANADPAAGNFSTPAVIAQVRTPSDRRTTDPSETVRQYHDVTATRCL